MPPEAAPGTVVDRLIAAVRRRRLFLHVAYAVAIGAAVGLPLDLWMRFGVVLLAAAAGAAWTRKSRTPAASARAIERACVACRNVVITAEELARHPERASVAIRERVLVTAARAVADVRVGQVVPIGRGVAAAAVASVLIFLPLPERSTVDRAVSSLAAVVSQAAAAAPAIHVTVDPPAYSRQPRVSMTDPDRIDALEGSRIQFDVPEGWRVRFGDAGPSTGLVARTSGYFALESGESGEVSRLLPLNVTPDRAPSVRIEAPGKDLLLPDGTLTIPVRITASDDLALEGLELRYTKVSGSGEQFEFVEGAMPVTIQRTTDREWSANGQLALGSLKLGPGDSLVYRAVARDARPDDAGVASSDTYFIEIAGPGQVPLEGVEMPPELERYAMSQQMIVLKLERLRAREPKMTRDAVAEEAVSLAAEQRTVRANFVFLLGGHVEDEFEEAEQSHEIQEGRLENSARKDINAAISQMTRAEQGLTAVNTAAALPPAREAVESLQRAFGRSRYLLRSLAVRSRLDPSRRLTGDLEGAGDWRRTLEEASAREGEAARRLLNALIAVSAASRAGGPMDARQVGKLAESALAIDPSSPLWSEIARQLIAVDEAEELMPIVARVSEQASRGLVQPTPLAQPASPLERAFMTERQR